MSNYKDTLTWCTAALVIKNMVNHLMTVRCRLATRIMNQEVTSESEVDKWMLPVFPLFYYSFCCHAGPLRSENNLLRFQVMASNASQNEPYFLALGLLWALKGNEPGWAPKALLGYTYSRLAHYTLYSLGGPQPFRALAWAVGAGINLVMAISMVRQGKK